VAIATAVPVNTRQFSFEWFSDLPLYRGINRPQLEKFLSGLRIPGPWVAVDVACGVGLMTELCHEIKSRVESMIKLSIGIDLDFEALEIARDKLTQFPARFVQSLGQRLPVRDSSAHFVTIGNSIHNFDLQAKIALLGEAFRVLREGAGLFFNSTFYDGCLVEGTERFYLDHVRGALRYIRRMGAPAKEGAGTKPEAVRWLAPGDYVELTREAGFADVQAAEMTARIDQETFEAISSYSAYAQGALHYRFPPEVACVAMREAARELFADPDWARKYGREENGVRFVPRRWLIVTARKPGARAGR